MIGLENVTKCYSTIDGEVRALDGVSLDVAVGEFVAVRGPSGCGKSTLLNLIGGLALPTAGRVVVDGRDISSLSAADRAHFRAAKVGFVFQMFHLLPYLNVGQNVLVARNTDLAAGDAEDRAKRLLDRFGLSARLTHRPGQLSAGERQRVAMARALVNEPSLLLADEPTGNLDPENGAEILRCLGELAAEGLTILMVTHEESAAACAGRTIRLRHGKLEEEPATTLAP